MHDVKSFADQGSENTPRSIAPTSPTSASRAGRIGQRAAVARLPSGLRFRRTSVHGLRGGRTLDDAARALPFQEGEELRGPRGQALERYWRPTDPAGDVSGRTRPPTPHAEPGPP